MARFEFGGTMAAWLVSSAPADVIELGAEVVTLPQTDVTLEIYDAPAGALVTDFLDEAGNPITEIVVPAGDPYIPRFQGPDGVEQLWVQSSTGRWLPVPRTDGGTGSGGDDDTDEVRLSGGNTYEYTSSNDGTGPWLRVDVPSDGTDSNAWPNRMEFRFWDDSTSQYRHGFHVNEKALLRTRGTTPTDVPVRFMAHPNQDPNTAVMEVTRSDNTVKALQVFQDRVVVHVDIQVPFLVNEQGERLYFGSQDPNAGPYPPRVGDAWIDFNGEA